MSRFLDVRDLPTGEPSLRSRYEQTIKACRQPPLRYPQDRHACGDAHPSPPSAAAIGSAIPPRERTAARVRTGLGSFPTAMAGPRVKRPEARHDGWNRPDESASMPGGIGRNMHSGRHADRRLRRSSTGSNSLGTKRRRGAARMGAIQRSIGYGRWGRPSWPRPLSHARDRVVAQVPPTQREQVSHRWPAARCGAMDAAAGSGSPRAIPQQR